jgi:hypothetical protein
MRKYEVTTRGESKRVMFFDSIKELDIQKTEQVAELPREEYTVFINMLQKLPFQFDGENFYLDVEDVERNIEQLDKLAELTEGKDKDESAEIMKEHHIEYVKRQIVYIEVGDKTDIIGTVKGFIAKHF